MKRNRLSSNHYYRKYVEENPAKFSESTTRFPKKPVRAENLVVLILVKKKLGEILN